MARLVKLVYSLQGVLEWDRTIRSVQIEHTYLVRAKGFQRELEGFLDLGWRVITRGDRKDLGVDAHAFQIKFSE